MKKAEISIAYLNTKLSALESGARDKVAVHNDLQMKLSAAAMTKWDTERQQLRDEIARAQLAPSKNATKPLRPSAGLRWRRTTISCGGQISQGVQGPRHTQTVEPHEQSQQPPVQPICARGYDTSLRTTRQTLSGPGAESPRSRQPEPKQAPTEGPETSNRTRRAQRSQPLHRACSLGRQ